MTRRLRDFIETGPRERGYPVHEAAAIRTRRGLSVYAVALCGRAFATGDEWVRGFGYDDRATCAECREVLDMTEPAPPLELLDLEATP